MSAFLTALFIILFTILVFVLIGLYLLSKMVGGFGNLKAIYRLFSGKGTRRPNHHSAKSSSSRGSSRHASASQGNATRQQSDSSDGKVFGENEGTYVEFEEVKE